LSFVLVASAVFGQSMSERERFTAVAVNLGSNDRAWADRVEIVVNRWSTAVERDRLLTALFEQGSEKLLDALMDMPAVGYIRTPNSIGYDLHFARKTRTLDGGQRIVLAADRYITFWEAVNRPRSIEYPFTVMELHLNAEGSGEGKLSPATRITGDKENKLIVLENYSTQPVLLNDVRAERP
jgi:hypothetical protein